MRPITVLALALATALPLGCTLAPARAFAAGEQVAFDGRAVSIDTAPWAYDGNGVVVVASDAQGPVRVELPARWNLCKAAPVDAQALKAGDRVHVVATANDAGSVTVCERTEHRLQRTGG